MQPATLPVPQQETIPVAVDSPAPLAPRPASGMSACAWALIPARLLFAALPAFIILCSWEALAGIQLGSACVGGRLGIVGTSVLQPGILQALPGPASAVAVAHSLGAGSRKKPQGSKCIAA